MKKFIRETFFNTRSGIYYQVWTIFIVATAMLLGYLNGYSPFAVNTDVWMIFLLSVIADRISTRYERLNFNYYEQKDR